MPEGDTIHRTAATLARALVGRRLTRLQAPRLPFEMPPEGTGVQDVRAIGKHLLLDFDDGHVLHTHLGMSGSWFVQPTGQRWRRRRHRLRAWLADETVQATCFDALVVELLDHPAEARHPVLRRLGPDLCRPDVDLARALARMATIPPGDAVVVDVLLDQRVVAGIGNVYASELAFLAGLHPATPFSLVDETTRHDLLADAARLLQANLTSAQRTTVSGGRPGRLWVYGRHRQPCRRCGSEVQMARMGTASRPTYWCPMCQPRGATSPVQSMMRT